MHFILYARFSTPCALLPSSSPTVLEPLISSLTPPSFAHVNGSKSRPAQARRRGRRRNSRSRSSRYRNGPTYTCSARNIYVSATTEIRPSSSSKTRAAETTVPRTATWRTTATLSTIPHGSRPISRECAFCETAAISSCYFLLRLRRPFRGTARNSRKRASSRACLFWTCARRTASPKEYGARARISRITTAYAEFKEFTERSV